jgi:hypothetical protein
MTPEQFAAMKPHDVALVRAKVLPRGEGGNAGDHVQIEIAGGGILWAPIKEIIGVLHPAEAAAQIDDVIAPLCSEMGRKIAA